MVVNVKSVDSNTGKVIGGEFWPANGVQTPAHLSEQRLLGPRPESYWAVLQDWHPFLLNSRIQHIWTTPLYFHEPFPSDLQNIVNLVMLLSDVHLSQLFTNFSDGVTFYFMLYVCCSCKIIFLTKQHNTITNHRHLPTMGQIKKVI